MALVWLYYLPGASLLEKKAVIYLGRVRVLIHNILSDKLTRNLESLQLNVLDDNLPLVAISLQEQLPFCFVESATPRVWGGCKLIDNCLDFDLSLCVYAGMCMAGTSTWNTHFSDVCLVEIRFS